MEPTPSTFHSVQVLRTLAALLVVLFHGQAAFSEAGARELIQHESYGFGFGAVGVHIFFVVSGFIMVATSWNEPSFQTRAFLNRRCIRIYPTYWICVALYLLYHYCSGSPYDLGWQEFAGSLLLWPGVSASVIGPAWTLSYEMFFYICFALTMPIGMTRGCTALAVLFVALSIVGALFQPQSALLHFATNSLLLEFIAGMGIGWLLKRGALPTRAGVLWIALALFIFAAGAVYGYARAPSVLMWGAPSALLVLGAVCLELRHGAARAVRAVGRLGDSSYSLYLLHILFITFIVDAWQDARRLFDGNAALGAVTSAAVCLVAAELFHRSVERPLLRFLKPRRTLVPSPTVHSEPKTLV